MWPWPCGLHAQAGEPTPLLLFPPLPNAIIDKGDESRSDINPSQNVSILESSRRATPWGFETYSANVASNSRLNHMVHGGIQPPSISSHTTSLGERASGTMLARKKSFWSPQTRWNEVVFRFAL